MFPKIHPSMADFTGSPMIALDPQVQSNTLYNPFSDYLGLAPMLQRQNMADNFEKLVSETCRVPGADLYNEVNRLFFQNDERDRIQSWGSNSSESGASTISSTSPTPVIEPPTKATVCRKTPVSSAASSHGMTAPQVTTTGLLQPVSSQLGSSNSPQSQASASRLPPSVQLARKLTAKSMCVFCKNNGEMESVYGSHVLKNEEGHIVCPILRAYTCPICGVSGDNAHTIKYCPQGNNESTIKALKQTRNSTARRSTPSGISTLSSVHSIGAHPGGISPSQHLPPVSSSHVAAAAALLNAATLYGKNY